MNGALGKSNSDRGRTEGANVEAEGPAKKAVTGRTILYSLKLELEKSAYYFLSYISYILFKFPCKRW